VTSDFFVCELSALDDPGARGFVLSATPTETIEIIVVRVGRQVHAYEDSCPHTGVSLAWMPNRYLDADHRYLQCATHGALFTLDGGDCVRGPCLGQGLRRLGTEIRDGGVYILDCVERVSRDCI
jgi:nitrite reductase/ring-hydroxylating ferredoxin subunit